jgi:hypothetical protein
VSTARTIIVDGKPATVVDEWVDHEDRSTGYDYRFDGDNVVHWIRTNNPRLGQKGPVHESI